MTNHFHKNILILADIEGSSCCNDYESTRFLGKGWPRACRGMTRDVNAVVTALFDAGAEKIYVKDFHRTGYNVIRSGIHPKATLISGYKIGPVPGIGPVYDATGLIMLGMHAPSGSPGFLAHTLTSRVIDLSVNGCPMSEAQLFSASLAPYNIVPLFFSGCPIACKQASLAIPGMHHFPITEKNKLTISSRQIWRKEAGSNAAGALSITKTVPYLPKGPFHAKVTLKGKPADIRKTARQWGLRSKKNCVFIDAEDIHSLYLSLIHLLYLSPLVLKILPLGLSIYNLMGRAGLAWAAHPVLKYWEK